MPCPDLPVKRRHRSSNTRTAEVKSKEYKSNYESLYGGYVPNMGGWADRGQSFDAKAEVARLQAEGKLPKPSDGQK